MSHAHLLLTTILLIQLGYHTPQFELKLKATSIYR